LGVCTEGQRKDGDKTIFVIAVLSVAPSSPNRVPYLDYMSG